MKKTIFLCAIICTSFLTNAQHVSNKEALDILAKSLDYNVENNGVKNPNMIYPGNKMSFLLKNGDTLTFPIKKGDNMWLLAIKAKKHDLNYPDNPIVNLDSNKNSANIQPTTTTVLKEKTVTYIDPNYSFWIKVLIFVIIFLYVINFLFTRSKRLKK